MKEIVGCLALSDVMFSNSLLHSNFRKNTLLRMSNGYPAHALFQESSHSSLYGEVKKPHLGRYFLLYLN